MIAFASLSLFFTDMGLNAFGVNISMISNTSEISFLLFSTFMLLIVSISLIYLFLPVWLPIVLAVSLLNYFLHDQSILTNMWVVIIFAVALLIMWSIAIIIKKLPQKISNSIPYIDKIRSILSDIASANLIRQGIDFVIGLSFVVLIVMYAIVVAIVFIPSASSILKPNEFSKHLLKNHYEMVMSVYQNTYTGYPKILIDEKDKIYYVPYESQGYYYAYDIDEVRKAYFERLKSNNKERVKKVCGEKEEREIFMRYYIIDNPYIKVAYQNNLRFKIDDNKTEIDINKSESFRIKSVLINQTDINQTLCDGKMQE